MVKINVKYVHKLDDPKSSMSLIKAFNERWGDEINVLPDSVLVEDVGMDTVIVVFGGDGTMLHTMKRIIRPFTRTEFVDRPHVVGINNGKVGYLTSFTVDSFGLIMKGQVREVYYPILVGSVNQQPFHAVNEVMLSASNIGLPVTINIEVNDKQLYNFSGTGVIVSTPTGSTAINLSAGGPIMLASEGDEHMIITPILAHSVKTKPIVLSNRSKVLIKPTRGPLEVFADGQSVTNNVPVDSEVELEYNGLYSNIYHPMDWSIIDVLHEKILSL